MRLATRKSLSSVPERDDQGEVIYLTREGIEKIQRDIDRLEQFDLPKTRAEVAEYVQQGDLSENAEYQEAKHRLARQNSSLFYLQDRLKRASMIPDAPKPGEAIQMGSSVTVDTGQGPRTYHLVGPQETNPSQGRISYLSPLGQALLGKKTGESVYVKTEAGERIYRIL